MGDKSPKSAQKQSKQNKAKADEAQKQKQKAIFAKQSPGGGGKKK
jgi:hypothetical protein